MKRLTQATLAALVLAIGLPIEALAQSPTPCGATKSVRGHLLKQFSEVPVSIGMGANGSMVEVFASKKGTFSIVSSTPNGVSCLIAGGEYWEMYSERLKTVKQGPAT